MLIKSQKIVQTLICLLLLFSLTSCAKYTLNKREKALDASMHTFEGFFRWQDFESAFGYIQLREGNAKIPNFDYLKDIKVTRYEIKGLIGERGLVSGRKEIGKKSENADMTEKKVTVTVEYYHGHNPTLKTLRYTHLWWYSFEAEHWFIDTQFPEF